MRSLVLRTASSFLLVLLALFSIFMLLRGHEAPGGGFVAGLLLASALSLYGLSLGAGAARAHLGIAPRALLGLGLLVAAASAVIGLVAEGSLFSPIQGPTVPALGKLGTPLLFDIAVYMVVAGAMSEILLTLAED